MRKISCFVSGFQPYGMFVGALLQEQRGNLNQIRETVEFQNLLSDKLDDFLSIYDYNKANIEKYFSR